MGPQLLQLGAELFQLGVAFYQSRKCCAQLGMKAFLLHFSFGDTVPFVQQLYIYGAKMYAFTPLFNIRQQASKA